MVKSPRTTPLKMKRVYVMKKQNAHVCVECREPIPVFQKYLCEKCFQEMLKQKLEDESKND